MRHLESGQVPMEVGSMHPRPAFDVHLPVRHCLIPPPLVTQAHDTVSNTRVAIKKSALFSDANDPNDQGIPVPCPQHQDARSNF